MSKSAAPKSTPPSIVSGARSATTQKYKVPEELASSQRQTFFMMALNMSWQLVIVVLVPVIGGAELDKHLGGKHLWVFVGLGLAFVASIAVVWHMVRLANRLPVPRLTAAQKRAIQKQYEEDDDNDD